MRFLAVLLVGLVYAQKEKQCLNDVMNDSSKKTFEACKLNSKIDALEAALAACGGTTRAAVVTYQTKSMIFHTNTPAMAYEDLLEETVEGLTPGFDLSKHTFHYFMELDTPVEVTIEIGDNKGLARAFAAALEFGVKPVFVAKKMTPSPTKSPTVSPTPEPTHEPTNLPTSPPTLESYFGCLDVKNRNPGAKSGVYKMNTGSVDYETFCDMESAAGPYTLVAAIHEDNIDQFCGAKDTWSFTGGPQNSRNALGLGTWQNKNVFGDIKNAGQADFKNPGYWELASRRIMINILDRTSNPAEFLSKTWVGRTTASEPCLGNNYKNLYDYYVKHPVGYNGGKSRQIGKTLSMTQVRGSAPLLATHSAPNCRFGGHENQIVLGAWNCEGGGNALCLYKCRDCNTEHACIGGGGYWPGHGGRLCNDYSGFKWDTPVRANEGYGWSTSQRLINSVTHIYYKQDVVSG